MTRGGFGENSLMRKAFHSLVGRMAKPVSTRRWLSGVFLTAQAKSAQRTMKANMETTWLERPAIMMLMPVFCRSRWSSSAMDVMAPPAACRTSEMMSQVMKVMV